MEHYFCTIGDWFYWCYANLGMAHAAVSQKHQKYEKSDFQIRTRLFNGLSNGEFSIHSLFDDEKWKIHHPVCSYCGSSEQISVDHLIPRHRGGSDSGDNLIPACKKCNSSKGNKDLLEWAFFRGGFPPILVLRRYLKLAQREFSEAGCMSLPFSELSLHCKTYRLDLLPQSFPEPSQLSL